MCMCAAIFFFHTGLYSYRGISCLSHDLHCLLLKIRKARIGGMFLSMDRLMPRI